MRICIVADVFPRLSETFVLHQVEGLEARGHDVEVLCREVQAAADTPNARALRRKARRRWGALSVLEPCVGRMPPRARHKATGLLDRLDAAYLRGFDVALAHFGYEGARMARLKRRAPGSPPLVTIFHGHDVATVWHDGATHLYDELFRVGALHLCVNRRFRDLLIEAGAPEGATRVHRMGVASDDLPFRTRDHAQRPQAILTVARLTEKKGVAYALRALARLRETHPALDWRHRIVGDGALRAELEALRDGLGLDDRVAFLGARPHDEVRRLLAESHVFLLPSVTAADGDAEGVPVSLMEAMASGAIAVSTRHSGIPDLIEDGRTGYLAPERDAEALAEKLARALSPDPGRAALAEAARRDVERSFNLETQLDALEAALGEVARAAPR